MSGNATSQHLRDVRFVTAHYEMLQGLVVAPGMLVVAMLMFADTPAGRRFSGTGWLLLAIAAAVVGTALAVLAGRRYRTLYGEVQARPSQGMGYMLASLAALLAVGVVRLLDLDTPLSPEGVAVSLVAVGAGLRLGPLARPVITVAGIGLLLSLMPLGEWAGASTHPLSEIPGLLTAVALGQVAVALLSHQVLRRVLGGHPASSS
jgi:hypothetical protein